MIRAALAVAFLVAAPVAAAEEPDGRAIIAKAYEAAGGDAWAQARTLLLKGRATFYSPDAAAPRSTVDDYTMWRIFEADRASAHGEAGKVRIDGRDKGRLIFQSASDGETTWTQRGVVPKAEADAFWASNFGFGVIRHALKPGFTLTRVPDSNVDGHPAFMVRVTDPSGTSTLFGIDKRSSLIRMVGFATPRGWHVRHYDDFDVKPGWTQARKVTLYYNGVKQNELVWTGWTVNGAIDPALFSPENAGK